MSSNAVDDVVPTVMLQQPSFDAELGGGGELGGEEVVPECIDNEADSAAYQYSLKKAHALSHDRVDTVRERRWRHAEEMLAGSTMCSPNSILRKRWDVVQVFALVYVALFVPYRIGFTQDTAVGDFFFFVDVLVDLYFIMDIVLSFRTGFVDSRGELRYQKNHIASHYMSGWFAVDVASCLPVNYIALLPGVDMQAADARSNKMIKLLRLLRLLKLLRLMRFNRIIERYEQEFHALVTSMKLAKLMLLILAMGHWLGCAWYFCGDLDSEAVDPVGKPLIGWVGTHFGGKSQGENFFVRYLTAMYWSIMTMTTVGYGDIHATTIYEVACSIVAMMVGGFVFGMIVGNLSEVSRRANPGKNLEATKTGMLRGFLAERGVTKFLLKRITAWYRQHVTERTIMESEELLLSLPAPLRDELGVELGYVTGHTVVGGTDKRYSIVHKVPFLSELDAVSLIMICCKIKSEALDLETNALEHEQDDENGDERLNLLMAEGQPATFMTIIQEGEVEISKRGKVLGVLRKGDFFGEMALLRKPSSIKNGIRAPMFSRTATALSNCLLHTLSAEDFAELCDRRPAVARAAWPFVARAMAYAEDDTLMPTPSLRAGALGAATATVDNTAAVGRIEAQMDDVARRVEKLELTLGEALETQHKATMHMLQQILAGRSRDPSDGISAKNPMHHTSGSFDQE